jgi:hypothetical protein
MNGNEAPNLNSHSLNFFLLKKKSYPESAPIYTILGKVLGALRPEKNNVSAHISS